MNPMMLTLDQFRGTPDLGPYQICNCCVVKSIHEPHLCVSTNVGLATIHSPESGVSPWQKHADPPAVLSIILWQASCVCMYPSSTFLLKAISPESLPFWWQETHWLWHILWFVLHRKCNKNGFFSPSVVKEQSEAGVQLAQLEVSKVWAARGPP